MGALEQFANRPSLEQAQFVFRYLDSKVRLRGDKLSDPRHGVYSNYVRDGLTSDLVASGMVPPIEEVYAAYAAWRVEVEARKAKDEALREEFAKRQAEP